MVEERSEKQKAAKNNAPAAMAAVAVIILALAGAYYVGLFKAAEKPAEQPAGLDAYDAKLLLSSMQKEAALGETHMEYVDVENGAATTYEVRINQTDSWVLEQGDYGALEGYFGADNRSYVVCLAYQNRTKCAATGTNPDALAVAMRLRTRLPDSRASLSNMRFAEKLIGTGAMKFSGKTVNASFGGFETEMLSYRLDYRNLTVQTLNAIGVSPNDPSIYSISDWIVYNWIDRKTGLLVRSNTTYTKQGALHSFSREYLVLDTGAAGIREKPEALVSSAAFVKFYQDSEGDYIQRMGCLAKNSTERSTCLKSLAVESGDASACGLIADTRERGLCIMIVAQTTRAPSLCASAGPLADDCYISVVGETGDETLCRNLQNASLAQSCYAAKIAGEKKAADKKAADEKALAGQNCANDSGCHIAGNANQYCAPVGSTSQFAVENAPQFACLAGVPCGCVEGYCQFRKQENENYTKCMSQVESSLTAEFIKSLAREAEAAANKTGNATANGTMVAANNTAPAAAPA